MVNFINWTKIWNLYALLCGHSELLVFVYFIKLMVRSSLHCEIWEKFQVGQCVIRNLLTLVSVW